MPGPMPLLEKAFASLKPKARRSLGAVHGRMAFFCAWLKNPRAIGAVLPSSDALARAITRDVDSRCGLVMELGSGTGVITRQLCKRGVSAGNLVLIESNPGFVRYLRGEFPGVRVLPLDACRLGRAHHALPRELARVICGLPLLNLSRAQQFRVLRGSFSCLSGGGAFYLFTYGLRCPVDKGLLQRLDLHAERAARVLRNLPPAQIWKLTRKASKDRGEQA